MLLFVNKLLKMTLAAHYYTYFIHLCEPLQSFLVVMKCIVNFMPFNATLRVTDVYLVLPLYKNKTGKENNIDP